MTENAIQQDAQEGIGAFLGLLFYLAAASVGRCVCGHAGVTLRASVRHAEVNSRRSVFCFGPFDLCPDPLKVSFC